MKKSISLGIRKILEELSEQSSQLFRVEFEENSIVTFLDIDETSHFYFKVDKMQKTNVKTTYPTRYRPSSTEHIEEANLLLPVSQIKNHFTKWRDLVIEYSKPSTLFDDNFTQTYYNDIESSFKIVDEDAEYNPYSIEQQKRIVKFLDAAQKVFEEAPNNLNECKETIELIESTKTNITRSTKNEIIKKIRKIVAKGFKIGLTVGEKLLIEFTAELSKKLLLGG